MKNYHTHTKRCYHAIGSEEEYIEAAIQAGYSELGFSDHTPWHYDSSFHATMRMEEDKLPGYIQKLLQMREKYQDQISIKIGLECEYFEKYMPWLEATLKQYPIDYIILGNHYDETDETGIYFGSPLTKQQFKKYVDACIKAINTGLFSYVAHPDLAYYDTNDPYYIEQMKRLCEGALQTNTPLEFNLLGYKTYRQYPNETFFKLVKKMGNQVIIGTDAHEPNALLDQKTYQKALHYLHQLGIEPIEEIKFLR